MVVLFLKNPVKIKRKRVKNRKNSAVFAAVSLAFYDHAPYEPEPSESWICLETADGEIFHVSAAETHLFDRENAGRYFVSAAGDCAHNQAVFTVFFYNLCFNFFHSTCLIVAKRRKGERVASGPYAPIYKISSNNDACLLFALRIMTIPELPARSFWR